jgi:GntR family transcriptional regulator / MocR family aminotransferase
MIERRQAKGSRGDAVPAYRRVYERIRSEVLSGQLAPGARLPSSRTLANQLGVARGTIEIAFQMLAGEGITVSDGARGTIVNPALPRTRKTPPRATPPAARPAEDERNRVSPGLRMFQMGLPALDVFPRKQWAQVVVRLARKLDTDQLAHPYDVLGFAPLRHALASYLRIARDITCSADQIMITAGYQGALGLIMQALLKPGDEVWVEDPGYFFAHNQLREQPFKLIGVAVDEQGINVADGTRAAPEAALALVTPTHQFPLCMTLPVDRRLALLDWADRARAFIVEDDYDSEFHHRGLPPPALKSLDRRGRVLYVGSFSKVLFPGLRLGYLVIPDAVMERFVRVAAASHPAPALIIQKMVEAFMTEGHFARHLSRMRTLYTERRKTLASALAAAMPEQLEINLADGGMHFVARLRGPARDTEILPKLLAQGLAPSPLSRCALTGAGLNGLMIGYANVPQEDAPAAAQRMLAAIRG